MHRTDARHGQHRVHVATRVLVWRSAGASLGLLIAVPTAIVAIAIWGGPS